MKNIYQILLFLLVTISINSSEKETNRHFCYHLVNESKDELELENSIKKYFKQMKNDSTYCIQYLLKTSNYNALEVYVTQLNDAGIKFRETLSNSINSIEKELTEIYNKYKYKKEEYQKVVPAVQWAQNMTYIFLEIKFSHRHDSPGCLEVNDLYINISNNSLLLNAECILGDIPIKFELDFECLYEFDQNMSHIFLEVKFSHRHDSPGCLEVNDLNINITNNSLLLNAECILGDIPIKFELDFNCLNEFDKNMSQYKPGSVGRYQLFIKKKENKYWERLLLNESDTPTNLRIWFEMKNKYDDQIKKYEKKQEIDDNDKTFEELEKEIKENMKKEKEEKRKNKKDKKNKKHKKNKNNKDTNNKEDL